MHSRPRTNFRSTQKETIKTSLCVYIKIVKLAEFVLVTRAYALLSCYKFAIYSLRLFECGSRDSNHKCDTSIKLLTSFFSVETCLKCEILLGKMQMLTKSERFNGFLENFLSAYENQRHKESINKSACLNWKSHQMRHIFLYSKAHWKKIALFIDALCNTEAKRTHIPRVSVSTVDRNTKNLNFSNSSTRQLLSTDLFAQFTRTF